MTNIDLEKATANLSGGLKFKTISNVDYSKSAFEEFDKFIEYLKITYPLIFEKTEFQRINGYALLFKLNGSDNNLNPVILTGHYDVVAADDEAEWEKPPFSGFYNDEYIISRGSMDDKGSIFSILEALNSLLEDGFMPKADLYLGFSNNEETGGVAGAPDIIKYLKENNIKMSTVLDEGGRILEMKNKKYALVGMGEKGRIRAKIVIKSKGGHASKPFDNTSVSKLGKLINAFEKYKTPLDISDDIYEYYKATIDSYDFYTKFLIKLKPLLKPILLKHLAKNPSEASRLRTTVAITMLEASKTSNVISPNASMILDIRTMPGHSVETVKKYIDSVLDKTFKGDDRQNIEVIFEFVTEPSNYSPIVSDEFKRLSSAIKQAFPDVVVVPTLTLAGTDARNYEAVSDNVYRLLPMVLSDVDYNRMHAKDERLLRKNYYDMINFYQKFIRSI